MQGSDARSPGSGTECGMKLAKGFVTQNYRDEQLMVAMGQPGEAFHGLVRSNATAAFIIEKLKTETTPRDVASALTEEYDVDFERALRDTEAVIEKLRSIGAIEE